MVTTRRGLLEGALGLAVDRLGPNGVGQRPEAGPFSRDGLADRAEALGREAKAFYPAGDRRLAIGEEVARAFREGRCQTVPQFGRLASVYDQLYWSRRFYEIFPNGNRLADFLVRLDNTDISKPKFGASVDSLVREYYERADELAVDTLVLTDPISLPSGEPLVLSRFAARLWSAVEATGRGDAARAATSHAQASARYVAPSIARWLDANRTPGRPVHSALIPLEIGRYGALWAVVEDVVGPSAIEPLAIAISAGYVPIGEVQGRFVLVTQSRPTPYVVGGLSA